MGTPAAETPTPEPRSVLRPAASLLAVAAALVRLLPHPPNLTPIGAVGLFSGARLRSWYAFALPLSVLVGSNLVLWYLNDYDRRYLPSYWVCGAFAVNVLIGRLLVRTESPWRIGSAAVLCSIQFYLVTNFGVWLMGSMYPHTPAGLWLCYAAGLPFAGGDAVAPLGFFGNTLLGDLGYSAVLFGAHALLTRTVAPTERAPVTDAVP